MDADDIITAGRAIRTIAETLEYSNPGFTDLDELAAAVAELVAERDALRDRVAELEAELARRGED